MEHNLIIMHILTIIRISILQKLSTNWADVDMLECAFGDDIINPLTSYLKNVHYKNICAQRGNQITVYTSINLVK